MTSLQMAHSAHAPQIHDLSPRDRDTSCLRSHWRISPVANLPRHTYWLGTKRSRNEFCSLWLPLAKRSTGEPASSLVHVRFSRGQAHRSPMQDKATPPDCHPRCPACDVPMWLVRIERTGRSHFECKACGATTVEPAPVERCPIDPEPPVGIN